MKQESKQINQIISLIKPETVIVITTHRAPDGDAIGSSLGLYHFLKNRSSAVTVITPDDYPDYLHWLPGDNIVKNHYRQKEQTEKMIAEADLIFMLDFNHLARTEKMESCLRNSKAIKIMIDHHPDPENLSGYLLSDISASSTAEMVYEFIRQSGLHKFMDKDIATCLLTGIMTDTGAFTYNTSSHRTFGVIARLIRYGVDQNRIHQLIYDNFSYDRMRFLGYCLDNKMVVLPQFHSAYIYIDISEMKKYNYVLGDTEGFVNYPLSIKGIVFSALFIEKKDHIKISFRSKGHFSVNLFAQKHFSGGGHRNASGGKLKLSMQQTIEAFNALLPEYQDELKSSLILE